MALSKFFNSHSPSLPPGYEHKIIKHYGNYIGHDFDEEAKDVDFKSLREDLRYHLGFMVKKLSDNFDLVSTRRLKADSVQRIDMTMELGSSGVILALWRYI
jgi:hypothetical protein